MQIEAEALVPTFSHEGKREGRLGEVKSFFFKVKHGIMVHFAVTKKSKVVIFDMKYFS